MSYTVIKGSKQLDVMGVEVDDQIFLPLEALWDDYTILKEKKIIFLDSPLNGLNVGLLNLSSKKEYVEQVIILLEGAGCKVTLLEPHSHMASDLNIIIVLNPTEGVYQTSYGGYKLNGSKKIANSIGWAMAKFFELDYISPPVKEKIKTVKSTLWKKFTVPLVTVKWRQGRDSDLLLGVSILMGLFRFATKDLPLIDEEIFLNNKEVDMHLEEEIVQPPVYQTYNVELEPLPQLSFDDLPMEKETVDKKVEKENVVTIKTNLKEVDDMARRRKNEENKLRGKKLENPSPALQHYMKTLVQKQKEQMEKDIKKNTNPIEKQAAKLAGLDK